MKKHLSKRRNQVMALPKSATCIWINLFGVAGAVFVIFFSKDFVQLSSVEHMICVLLGYLTPVLLLELLFIKPHQMTSNGLNWHMNRHFSLSRVAVKLLGFYTTLLVIAFAYWLLPEYGNGIKAVFFLSGNPDNGFYQHFWSFLRLISPVLLALAIPYFFFIDRLMDNPNDGYWYMGKAMLLKFRDIDKKIIKQHWLGWLVKGYFLPLMAVYLIGNIADLTHLELSKSFSDFQLFFDFSWKLLYTIDLVIVTVGYIMAFRLFDSHIRSTEPTFHGWFFALICYQPFWSIVNHAYLNYDRDGFTWGVWLNSFPLLFACWGTLVLLLTGIYVWASVSFGLRFSNLTHRGILTNGAYKFTKHPAYVSKNISWWLIAVPFLVHSDTTIQGAFASCMMLLMVNGIYFMRARTEERHLSQDPIYIEYALLMNERSIFRWANRIIPSLRYKP